MSSTNPTFDEVWQLFQETDRLLKEQSRETERRFGETERLLKEQSRETERRFGETERLLKEQSRETERLLKEQSRETDRRLREVARDIGKLGNRLGDFIEEAVRPAAVRLFTERGIAIREVQQNVSSQRDGEGIEIDLLVVDDADLVAIECKSNLSLDDVNEHMERLGKLKRLLPRYTNTRVLGAVAAMVIPDQVARYAYRQGLYVISQNGEDLHIRNDAAFVPKAW